jgi:hypothetical protein
MEIAADVTTNFDDFTLRAVSILEYNGIPYYRILQYAQMYTNWDDNRLSCPQYVI